MEYFIENGKLKVTFKSLGAQITSVKYDGEERSWQNENGMWDDHAPILFPVCGRVATFFDGIQYPLPCHGFIYTNELTLKWKRKNAISFFFNTNEQTKKLFPFDFYFEVIYSIKSNTLKIRHIIRNLSDKVMPYGAGAHDSFVVTGNIEDYSVLFKKNEKMEILDEELGYLTGSISKYSSGKILKLKETNLKDNHSLVFENINSRKLSLVDGNGKKVVAIGFRKFKDLVLWRCENTNMICLEPWLNIPDKQVQEKREFSSLNGLRYIKPNKNDKLVRTITYY